MNITCDIRVEYTASQRHNHRWREAVELSLGKDDWSHNVIVIGSTGKKTRFQNILIFNHSEQLALKKAHLPYVPHINCANQALHMHKTINSDFQTTDALFFGLYREKLDNNVKKVHTENIKDGKVTISLVTPMVNIFMRNGLVEHLTPFIKLLIHSQKNAGDDLEEVAERWGILKRPVLQSSSSSESESSDDEEG